MKALARLDSIRSRRPLVAVAFIVATLVYAALSVADVGELADRVHSRMVLVR